MKKYINIPNEELAQTLLNIGIIKKEPETNLLFVGEIKFSQLPSGSAIQDADIFPSVQSGTNVKQSASDILAYVENTIDPTITLQNAYDTGDGTIQGDLDTKPIQFKNSGGTPLLNSNESKITIIGNASENLLIDNNLSDVQDVTNSRGNIGLPSQVLIADQDQNYVLTNPCPGIVYINMPTAGHQLKLPEIDVTGALDPSTVLEFVASPTSQSLDILDSNGNFIITINAGQGYIAIPIGFTLSPQTGWYFKTSSPGGAQDMQSTYNYGSTVDLASSQPIQFNTGTSYGDPQNLMPFYSPAFFSAPPTSYVIGMAFTAHEDGIVSALGYVDTAFSSGTRQVGLWSYTTNTTGTLLATANVAKNDPLDTKTNRWRMHSISSVPIVAGTRYVVAELNPTTDQWLGYQYTASPWATIDGNSQVNFASATLVYPPIVDVLAQGQWGNANLQFQSGSGDENFLFNDPVSNPNTIFQINSTARGSRPIPSMSQAQRDAIASPGNGDQVYVTDTKTIDYYDGTAWQTELTIDNLLAGDNITIVQNGDGTITISSTGGGSSGTSDYSAWDFGQNAVSSTLPASNTYYPVIINAFDFTDILSSNFVNEVVTLGGIGVGRPTPAFRYIDNATQYFQVNINLFVKGAVPSQERYIFQIYKYTAGGSYVASGTEGTALVQDLIFPTAVPLSGIVQLSTGDRIIVMVKNLDDTNSVIAYFGNASIVNINAAAASAMVWNEVTTTSQSMSPQNGYVANNAGLVTLTLPTVANFGSEIRVLGKGAGGWIISQSSGQSIVVGSSTSTVGAGGSIASTNAHDCLILTCTTADTQWTAYGIEGNLTVV